MRTVVDSKASMPLERGVVIKCQETLTVQGVSRVPQSGMFYIKEYCAMFS